MKKHGMSLITGRSITLRNETLPHRFRIQGLGQTSQENFPGKTLRVWFWLGGCAALLTLGFWLGV